MYVAHVPSAALNRWNTVGQQALDEIEEAHRAVGGVGRGRRYATLQVNHAYVALLSSQFQGFCRDLHTEAVAFIVGAAPAVLRPIFRNTLVQGRKLDHGNPNPGNLGSDFGRLDPPVESSSDVEGRMPGSRSGLRRRRGHVPGWPRRRGALVIG